MPLQDGMKSILKNGSLIAGVTWLEIVLRILYIVMLTRFLGPEGYGIWNYSLTVYGIIFSVMAFGFEAVVYYSFGESEERGRQVVLSALALRLLFSILALALFSVYVLSEVPAERRAALLFVTPIFIGRGFAELVRSIYVAQQNVARNLPNMVFFRVIEVTIGIGLLKLGKSVEWLLLLHVLSYIGEGFIGLFLLSKDYELRINLPKFAPAADLLKRSGPMAIVGMTHTFILGAPVLFFGWASSDLDLLGQLGVAMQLATIVLILIEAFLLAALPVVSHGMSVKDPRLKQYGNKLAFCVVVCFLVIIPTISSFAVPLISAIFGKDYLIVSELVPTALLISALYLLPIGYVQLFVIRAKYWHVLTPNLVACGIVVVGMMKLESNITPHDAVLVTCIAWATRAAIIVLFEMSNRGAAT